MLTAELIVLAIVSMIFNVLISLRNVFNDDLTKSMDLFLARPPSRKNGSFLSQCNYPISRGVARGTMVIISVVQSVKTGVQLFCF